MEPAPFSVVLTTPARCPSLCKCPPPRSPGSCWGRRESELCTAGSEPRWWGQKRSRSCFLDPSSSVNHLLTWWPHLLTFQGHPILRCVLPSFRTSSQARPALARGPNGAVLLVVYVWVLGWVCCSGSCQPLWWWVTFFSSWLCIFWFMTFKSMCIRCFACFPTSRLT